MQMVFQLLVLALTAYLWWQARRDLSRQAAALPGPAMHEWERLQETVQTLVGDLERRATVAEQRVAAAEQRMADAEARLGADTQTVVPPASAAVPAPEAAVPDDSPYPAAEQAAHDARYAPVYALVEAGVTETAEIAQRTGLGHGEVALVLGLHARHSR